MSGYFLSKLAWIEYLSGDAERAVDIVQQDVGENVDGERNVVFRENSRVDRVEDLIADVVIWCAGFSLSPIAAEAGLVVNERGQIVVDDHLRSSDPSILAIGDAASCRDMRMACATALPGTLITAVVTGSSPVVGSS